MIVCKFGGSATSCEKCIKNIKKISKNQRNLIFVFSAVGKTKADNQKLTDLLIDFTINHSDQTKQRIKNKLFCLNKICKLENLDEELNGIFQEYLKNKDNNWFISRGEVLTAKMMAHFLNIKFVANEQFLFFKNGNLDFEKSHNLISRLIEIHKRIVVPGFYAMDNGKVVLFNRGGGDLSGAIVSKLTNSNVYENFTDQEGVKQISPKIINSKTIKQMDYNTLLKMSQFGADVVQTDCVDELKNTNINLIVRSILNLNGEKTVVSRKSKTTLPAFGVRGNKIFNIQTNKEIEFDENNKKQVKAFIDECDKQF